MIETAKIFANGGSQAVRLPKDCRFSSDEVAINRIGDIVILVPTTSRWSGMLDSLDVFTDDFMINGRNDPVPEKRDDL